MGAVGTNAAADPTGHTLKTAARPPAGPRLQRRPPNGAGGTVSLLRLAFIPQPSDEGPEEQAPARPSNRPDRGDAWEPPTGEPTDEDAPTDGRQLLGWSSKQVPDAKGLILSYGRKNGLPSKIVGWSPQQVAAAYRFARARSPR